MAALDFQRSYWYSWIHSKSELCVHPDCHDLRPLWGRPAKSQLPKVFLKSNSLTLGKDWPPLFGRIKEAYTLRRFWNTFWHQIMRHMFISFSTDLKDLLKIRRGTWLSSYFELYFIFTLSALGHGLITYAMPYSPRHTFHVRFVMYFNFMFYQAPAIHFEDFIIWTYKRMTGETENRDGKPMLWQTIVGYVWVTSWWYFVLGWTMAAVLQLGIAKLDPLPFSILRPVTAFVERNLRSSTSFWGLQTHYPEVSYVFR